MIGKKAQDHVCGNAFGHMSAPMKINNLEQNDEGSAVALVVAGDAERSRCRRGGCAGLASGEYRRQHLLGAANRQSNTSPLSR